MFSLQECEILDIIMKMCCEWRGLHRLWVGLAGAWGGVRKWDQPREECAPPYQQEADLGRGRGGEECPGH